MSWFALPTIWKRGRRAVGDRDVEPVEHVAHVPFGRRDVAVRGEAEVDRDDAFVRHDVARHPARDPHRLQALPIHAAVDRHLARRVFAEPLEDVARGVDRVDAQPGPGRVRPPPPRGDLQPQGALAARLDRAAGGLTQEREIRVQPLPVLALDPAEAVAGRFHFLAVVEHDGEIVPGR